MLETLILPNRWQLSPPFAKHTGSRFTRMLVDGPTMSTWHKILLMAFFVYLIEKQTFSKPSSKCGRFRSFLLTAFKNFMANEWNKANSKNEVETKR